MVLDKLCTRFQPKSPFVVGLTGEGASDSSSDKSPPSARRSNGVSPSAPSSSTGAMTELSDARLLLCLSDSAITHRSSASAIESAIMLRPRCWGVLLSMLAAYACGSQFRASLDDNTNKYRGRKHTENTTVTTTTTTIGDCSDSDAHIVRARDLVCSSLVGNGDPRCGPVPSDTKAAHDWPSQVVYMGGLLGELVAPNTCLNTTVAAQTAALVNGWLSDMSGTASGNASFMHTYLVFQVQYYDMPRKPGVRIESPWTLGLKCWAFAYLRWIWVGASGLASQLLARMSAAGLDVSKFVRLFDKAVPLTMGLCRKVMANCFVNATYDPARNGTCPLSTLDFAGGFEWENIAKGFGVPYPF
eukprot:m.94238 g.94238  ORF g.94238 m.94238 type:complete len:358 (-) comp15115_c3_seq4:277-1350(-)